MADYILLPHSVELIYIFVGSLPHVRTLAIHRWLPNTRVNAAIEGGQDNEC